LSAPFRARAAASRFKSDFTPIPRSAAHGAGPAQDPGMNRHAELSDFFMAGCAILPLPLLWNFGPLAAITAMVPPLPPDEYPPRRRP
jgi:hypothetical protein